jgi:uncharacterized protein DUF3800
MRVSLDTSGPFDVRRASPGDPGVAAAVVVPERHRHELEAEIRELARRFGVSELHAVSLSPESLLHVARWMGRDERIVWTAALTDAAMFPATQLDEWRERQAGELEAAVAGVSPQRVEQVLSRRPLEWHLRRLRPGSKTSLPVSHFAEHLFVLPRTIGDAVQAAIDVFDGSEWHDEFDELTIDIDDSTARDAKAQLADLLKPILASAGLALVPPPRGGLEHPLFTKHVRDGRRGDLISLLGERIGFVPSHTAPLCQLADVASWVVHRYAVRPSDSAAAALYRALRPRQHGIEGSRGVRPMLMRTVNERAAYRYAHVLPWLNVRAA